MNIASLLSPVITAVAKPFTIKAETKQLIAKAKAGEKLGDTEWEKIMASSLGGSWKDEYITIVVTAPLVALIVGAFVADGSLLENAKLAIDLINNLDTDRGYGKILMYVVLAAIGIKAFRR